MKKFGVYHIFCKNNWGFVFNEQIDKIINTGLLSKLDKLFITVIFNNENELDLIYKKINGLNIEIIYKSNNSREYEFPALNFIKELCDNNDCYVFYMHTKGVSIDESNMRWYHGSDNIEHLRDCVNDWREYMEYFIIEKHELCFNVLENCDACGVNLIKEPTKHFSGNFWWSKSEYIKKLPSLNSLDLNHRWNAEFWIGLDGGRLHGFFKNNAGYVNRLNKKDYMV